MELWIRSQDKTFLKKVNIIGIVEGRDFWSISESITVDYGKYKTKERALEVLDEIHHKLDYIYELSLRPRALTTIEHKIVYEMPEE